MAMEKEMTFEETNAKVSAMFASIQEEFLTTKPMWMRLGLMSNMIAKARNEGHTDEDINWDKINKYLTTNVDPYDFNCFGEITSSDQLYEANMDARTASLIGAWQQHTCKDCGKTFFMTYNEVKFYEEKELHIPKRCKACRNVRKEINK